MKLEEDGLEIDFTNAIHALKFDQQNPQHQDFHDIQNMPRVDFVVELDNEIYFIEVKDPGRPNPADTGLGSFLVKLANGKLEDSLINKYWYSFIFRWAEDKLQKSVHYVCLITLESPLIPQITEGLERKLTLLSNSSSRWVRTPLASCQVHNLETWADIFPYWPVTRLVPAILAASLAGAPL